MTKKTPSALLSMNLFDLAAAYGWFPAIRNNMALLVYQGTDKPKWDNDEEYPQLLREWLERASKEVTLQQVIEKLEEQYRQLYIRNYWRQQQTRLARICALGFTRLNSVALPQSTVTIALLKTLTRPKLLALDGRLLGSIPEPVMAEYRARLQERSGILPPPFTIKELLVSSELRSQLPPKVVSQTIPILQELGLADREGVVIHPEPRPQLSLPDLLHREGVSKELAAQLVASAKKIKENWQKAPPTATTKR